MARKPCHALGHSLLAALPANEAVTTNYDKLFEQAWADVGAEVAVLPYHPGGAGKRWLLKMHGCVDHPEDIVLSRSHYLRYEERRAALTGIVQAMLITRHMLFVGFSLKDDNFHRIADAVRRAIQPREAGDKKEDAARPFGTSLPFWKSPLFESLWGGEMDFLPMFATPEPQEPDKVDLARAARRVELLLDVVAQQTAGTEHLMAPRYEPLLSDDDRKLRDALQQLAGAREDAGTAPGWERVEALLRAHGWRPPRARRRRQ